MKILEPRVNEIVSGNTIDDMWKSIEFAARVCTATQDKSSDNTEDWVNRIIIKSGHNRALEFGTAYLTLPWWRIITIVRYMINPYSRVRGWRYITTNYRVIHENGWQPHLRWFKGVSRKHAVRRTLLWQISRVTADSFRTHCSISSLMQSTRFCKYESKKFGSEVAFIPPQWFLRGDSGTNYTNEALLDAERRYLTLCTMGKKAEEAREVLPLCVATEFIQCAYEDDWRAFFKLRAEDSEFNHPHPESIFIASRAREILFPEH